ncbi:hypothetical protein B1218_39330, partial [Pseudomonas ogarae]
QARVKQSAAAFVGQPKLLPKGSTSQHEYYTAPAQLRDTLFQEIQGRILATDLSLPSPWGPYLYYTRTTAGDEYPRHYRCP